MFDYIPVKTFLFNVLLTVAAVTLVRRWAGVSGGLSAGFQQIGLTKSAPKYVLHVTNIPKSLNVDDIAKLVLPFGSIVELVIANGEESSLRSAFVVFGDIQSYRHAARHLDRKWVKGTFTRLYASIVDTTIESVPRKMYIDAVTAAYYDAVDKELDSPRTEWPPSRDVRPDRDPHQQPERPRPPSPSPPPASSAAIDNNGSSLSSHAVIGDVGSASEVNFATTSSASTSAAQPEQMPNAIPLSPPWKTQRRRRNKRFQPHPSVAVNMGIPTVTASHTVSASVELTHAPPTEVDQRPQNQPTHSPAASEPVLPSIEPSRTSSTRNQRPFVKPLPVFGSPRDHVEGSPLNNEDTDVGVPGGIETALQGPSNSDIAAETDGSMPPDSHIPHGPIPTAETQRTGVGSHERTTATSSVNAEPDAAVQFSIEAIRIGNRFQPTGTMLLPADLVTNRVIVHPNEAADRATMDVHVPELDAVARNEEIARQVEMVAATATEEATREVDTPALIVVAQNNDQQLNAVEIAHGVDYHAANIPESAQGVVEQTIYANELDLPADRAPTAQDAAEHVVVRPAETRRRNNRNRRRRNNGSSGVVDQPVLVNRNGIALRPFAVAPYYQAPAMPPEAVQAAVLATIVKLEKEKRARSASRNARRRSHDPVIGADVGGASTQHQIGNEVVATEVPLPVLVPSAVNEVLESTAETTSVVAGEPVPEVTQPVVETHDGEFENHGMPEPIVEIPGCGTESNVVVTEPILESPAGGFEAASAGHDGLGLGTESVVETSTATTTIDQPPEVAPTTESEAPPTSSSTHQPEISVRQPANSVSTTQQPTATTPQNVSQPSPAATVAGAESSAPSVTAKEQKEKDEALVEAETEGVEAPAVMPEPIQPGAAAPEPATEEPAPAHASVEIKASSQEVVSAAEEFQDEFSWRSAGRKRSATDCPTHENVHVYPRKRSASNSLVPLIRQILDEMDVFADSLGAVPEEKEKVEGVFVDDLDGVKEEEVLEEVGAEPVAAVSQPIRLLSRRRSVTEPIRHEENFDVCPRRRVESISIEPCCLVDADFEAFIDSCTSTLEVAPGVGRYALVAGVVGTRNIMEDYANESDGIDDNEILTEGKIMAGEGLHQHNEDRFDGQTAPARDYSEAEPTTSSYDSTSPNHEVHAHTPVVERVLSHLPDHKVHAHSIVGERVVPQSHLHQIFDVVPQTGRVENVRDEQQVGRVVVSVQQAPDISEASLRSANVDGLGVGTDHVVTAVVAPRMGKVPLSDTPSSPLNPNAKIFTPAPVSAAPVGQLAPARPGPSSGGKVWREWEHPRPTIWDCVQAAPNGKKGKKGGKGGKGKEVRREDGREGGAGGSAAPAAQ